MSKLCLRVTINENMVAYKHFKSLKNLDAVRKSIEVNRLIEAGYHALYGNNQPAVIPAIPGNSAIVKQHLPEDPIHYTSAPISRSLPVEASPPPERIITGDTSSKEKNSLKDLMFSTEKK